MNLEEAIKKDLRQCLEEWKKAVFTLGYETAKKEIVCCKDCKHRPKRIEEDGSDGFNLDFPDVLCPCYCVDSWFSRMPADDWFCGNGERSE